MIHHICVFHFQIVKVNGFVFLKEGPRVPRPSLEFDETVARNSECFNIVATGLFVCRCNSHEPFLPLQRSKALRTPDMPCYPVHCCQTVPSRQTHNVEPGSASFFELKLCVVVIEQLPINLCTTNLPEWTEGILCQVLCLDRPGLHKTGHPVVVVVVVAGGFRQETWRCRCHRQCLSRSHPEAHTHLLTQTHTHRHTYIQTETLSCAQTRRITDCEPWKKSFFFPFFFFLQKPPAVRNLYVMWCQIINTYKSVHLSMNGFSRTETYGACVESYIILRRSMSFGNAPSSHEAHLFDHTHAQSAVVHNLDQIHQGRSLCCYQHERSP